MALRTTCLCDGKIIGIETIYTVVNGMQINIPDKLEALRKRSKNNELFCPCGCGANLTLVAGDRNLRAQHFRLRNSQSEKECTFVTEGPVSACSKIVLKCWLDDKLPGTTIDSRVPVCSVDNTDRRYEITLLSKDKGIAISYCHEQSNLSDEKLGILDSNSAGIQMHYITDFQNTSTYGQYPEMMMKIQKRQGYCLFLKLSESNNVDIDYVNAELKVFYYRQNEAGLWVPVNVASDKLSAYSFDANGQLLYSGLPILRLKSDCEQKCLQEAESKKKARERYLEEIHARMQQINAEQKQRWWELQKLKEQQRIEKEEQLRHQLEEEAQKAAEKAALEKERRENLLKIIDATIDDILENPFYDPNGQRWVRCKYCGKIATTAEFVDYGGVPHLNLGKCNECYKKGAKDVLPQYIRYTKSETTESKPSVNQMTCPICGSKLKQRNGPYGPFLGCRSFPDCRYTKNI